MNIQLLMSWLTRFAHLAATCGFQDRGKLDRTSTSFYDSTAGCSVGPRSVAKPTHAASSAVYISRILLISGPRSRLTLTYSATAISSCVLHSLRIGPGHVISEDFTSFQLS